MTPQSAFRRVFETDRHLEDRGTRATRAIEQTTTRVPSFTFLNMAIASIVVSLGIAAFTRRAEWANFVGLWAPAFMLLGIYNRLVRRQDHEESV